MTISINKRKQSFEECHHNQQVQSHFEEIREKNVHYVING